MTEESENYDSHTEHDDYDDSGDEPRPLERWAPVGANDVDDLGSRSVEEFNYMSESERLRHLEEEQEQLNASLLALTSHFAQVQFRLKQIVDASADEKEELLKALEEFAFRGIPDTRSFNHKSGDAHSELGEKDRESKLNQQREKQKELIEQLKIQLEELERYAYETGEADMPQSMVMEKQKVIIDELKGKLPINLEQFQALTPEELRKQVDRAISQLINPVKMKEHLVIQLKTQITDLERFIEFLQGEATGSINSKNACICNCPVHGRNQESSSRMGNRKFSFNGHQSHDQYSQEREEEVRRKTQNIMKRVLTLMQMFIVTQFGCGGSRHQFQHNILKKTGRGNHWGDLRARLEIAIEHTIELASIQEQPVDSDYTSDSEDVPSVLCNEKLTTTIRKELSSALRDLIQHGLMPVGQSTSLVPFVGCFPVRPDHTGKMMHAWELILKYYELKNGKQYNSTPARRLSQSFNLDIIGGQAITSKQTLLGAVDSVISSHAPFKRSDDSHFKAFICSALNQKKLVSWLRLILRTRSLIEQYYQPWSYVARTGFEDTFHSLERLNQFSFELPVDLAVRPFQNIKDVF